MDHEINNYERTELVITEFDAEDIITTSGVDPEEYEWIKP